MKKTAIGILAIAGIAIVAYLVWGRKPTENLREAAPLLSPASSPGISASPSPTEKAPARSGGASDGASATAETHKTMRAKDIPDRASAFTFLADIPTGWQVQTLPQIEALNIYDPSAVGTNNLEKSQIFIRYFRANQFLTLSTVTILERREHEVAGRPAVTYIIEKKTGVPNFPNQPAWRNQKHRVTDIRVSDQNPSIFYVFAKRPELPEEIFEQFLASLRLGEI